MAFVPASSVVGFGAAISGNKHVCKQRSQLPVRPAPVRAPVVRMIAVEPAVQTTTLSQKAIELLSYLRAHKSIFSPGVGFTATHCSLFRKNDTGRSFTPLDELATNAHMLPGGSVAAIMKMQEEELVEKAKEAILKIAPAMENDETLSKIVWHDMWYMLRVISYGSAVACTNFIHENNLGMMKMFYEEIKVPEGVIATGLDTMKEAVLSQINDPSLIESTGACFDVVNDFLTS